MPVEFELIVLWTSTNLWSGTEIRGSFDVRLLITGKQDEQTERTSRETFRDLILYLILSAKSREFVLLKATSSPWILFLLSRRPFVPEQRRFLEWSTRYIFIRLVLAFFLFWSFLKKLEENVKKRYWEKTYVLFFV